MKGSKPKGGGKTGARAGIPAAAKVSTLETHLGYWLRFVSNQVSEDFRAAVEGCGVSVTDWVALRTLFDAAQANHGTLTQALGMTKGAVSKVIARLEAKGLVLREEDPADGRAQTLSLTRAGRALVPVLAGMADANDDKYFGHLPPVMRQQLRQALQELVRFHQLAQVPRA